MVALKALIAVMILAVTLTAVAISEADKKPDAFVGRWNLTITTPAATFPSWVEFTKEGDAFSARVQAREGSVHPAPMRMEGGRVIVTAARASAALPGKDGRPGYPARPEMTWELSLSGDRLSGAQKRGSEEGRIAGVRAPALKRPLPKAWSDPRPLFNGKDLTGWTAQNTTGNPNALKSFWVVRNGELINEEQGFNLITNEQFQDFRLHVEFNLPKNGNSGIYLRGRYENQLSGGAVGSLTGLGSIYGRIAPSVSLPAKPDEWRSEDITLVGRYVTILLDGTTLIDNQEIAGITGGALDSNEGEPGPLYLQGDHTGGIRFRNIRISVPKQ